MSETPASRLDETVVANGYCVGCGACASFDGAPFEIAPDAFGRYQARLVNPASSAPVLDICPFADGGPNEDDLAGRFAPDCEKDERIGFHFSTYAGWALTQDRQRGSSGGVTSWLLQELLTQGVVDYVIHVKPERAPEDSADVPLFRYGASASAEEVQRGAKTRYYPVEISEALRVMREQPGRYAFVGVPCFVKSVLRTARIDPDIAERLTVTVALVCGHLKSSRFADALGWQAGVQPETLHGIDFRLKLEGRPASKYGARFQGLSAGGDEVDVVRPMQGMDGQDWGHGMFKYNACEFCDDVLGETADVAFGDAWLPAYDHDWEGTNVIVVRSPMVDALLRDGAGRGELQLNDLSPEDVAASQDAGLRHRRGGLAYRLALADAEGRWRPPKRVAARTDHLTDRQQAVFRLRTEIAATSHTAFAKALTAKEYVVFSELISPLLREYRKLYRRSLRQKVETRLKRARAKIKRDRR